VNTAPGLPGWSQVDVETLRSAIASTLAARTAALHSGNDTKELDGILGNYLGQAVTRGIPFEDLVSLTGAALSSDAARSIVDYLHFYENVKFQHAGDSGYAYAPTSYPPEIAQLVVGAGMTLDRVLSIDATAESGSLLSACYTGTTFAKGITLLVAPTNIWVATGDDDSAADVPVGFPLFFFYDCQNGHEHMVRVSTTASLLFQQGRRSTSDSPHSYSYRVGGPGRARCPGGTT
jgi:hypothetical protein